MRAHRTLIPLAFVLDGFDWDFDAAGKEFRRAIELNPGYATINAGLVWRSASRFL